MKKYGDLHIKFHDGKAFTYHNVTNFNLIEGFYYIWFRRGNVVTISNTTIYNFYYSYTPY